MSTKNLNNSKKVDLSEAESILKIKSITNEAMTGDCNYYETSQFKTNFPISESLSFFHLSISSLPKHFENLTALLQELEADFKIIGITETRLKTDTLPHNLDIPKYTFLANTTESSAGGTALYIHESLDFRMRDDLAKCMYKSKELESTFIELDLPNQSNMIVGCIYKHPSFSKRYFTDEYLQAVLDKTNRERKILVILGDFNINLLDDQSLDVNHFVDCLSSNSVLPLITLPTRFSNTHNETLIDNIFSGTQDFDIKSGNILAAGPAEQF